MLLGEIPRIEQWMDTTQRSFRKNARMHVATAINKGLLGDIQPVPLRIFQGGDSSVVFKAQLYSGNLIVIKMSIDNTAIEAEALFLKKWAENGIQVPQVYAVHSADQSVPVSMSVMEYISTPTLHEAYTSKQLVALGLATQLGSTLARIHTIKGQGYGQPTVADSMSGDHGHFYESVWGLLQDSAAFLMRKQILIQDDFDSAKRAVEIIEEDNQRGMQPSLTHNDFRPYNMFATKPVTIFDPSPQITHPYLCLALPLIKPLVEEKPNKNESEEFLKGYEKVTRVDRKVLSAAMRLTSLSKLYSWFRKGKDRKVDRLIDVFRSSEILAKTL